MLNIQALALLVSEKKIFPHCKLMADIDAPGAQLAGFMKGTTKHCYMQNIKAPGPVVSEKIFYVSPSVSLYVFMETKLVIQSAQKANAITSPTQ